MQALLETHWQSARRALREAVGDAVFLAWLGELRPLAMERGVVHLEAPNRLIADRATALCLSAIEAAISTAMGVVLRVTISAAPTDLAPDHVEVAPTRPVVDASNRTAWLLLAAIAERRDLPGTQFFFHGPAGVGKTFLLEWWRATAGVQPIWRDGATLVRTHQAARHKGRIGQWDPLLVDCERLVIDELHRVAGHLRVQRDLAGVLEERSNRGRLTLLASRWHPSEIRDLDSRLRTWLLSGFVTEIGAPGPQARLSYLRALEGAASRNGRAEAIEQIAIRTVGGFPELRQAWQRERRSGQGAFAKRYFELIDPRSTFDRLLTRTAEQFGVETAEICGDSQRRRVSLARKALGWACVKAGLSRAEVGRYLGRTRAAVSYLIQSLESEVANDAELRAKIEALE
jgi:chromosomal replication initiation ATPase DnaA